MFGKKEKKEKKLPRMPTTWYGKLWFFIWHDNSPASWIVNIILAFIIIKFIVYPGLGWVFGTNFPIVAVVSDSMEHRGMAFDDWWAKNEDYYLAINITKDQFEDYPFRNGFNRGDIMFLTGKKAADIKVGEVIVFQSKLEYPIIHRVIAKDEKGMWVFETKGDNNPGQIRNAQLDETQVLETHLLGRAAFKVPFLGFVKIWFVDFLRFIGIGSVFGPTPTG